MARVKFERTALVKKGYTLQYDSTVVQVTVGAKCNSGQCGNVRAFHNDTPSQLSRAATLPKQVGLAGA